LRTGFPRRIADAIARSTLDPDQEAQLERLLGKDYEVITADDRLDKIAADFVEHCSTRWQSGKSMLVCIDKITAARMQQRIIPRWQAKLAAVQTLIPQKEIELVSITDDDVRAVKEKELTWLRGQAAWMAETIIEIIISEAQNEVADFKKWSFDIILHRALMKQGFEVGDRGVASDALRQPRHHAKTYIVPSHSRNEVTSPSIRFSGQRNGKPMRLGILIIRTTACIDVS
jgi:type I restriction enzyme R subunit